MEIININTRSLMTPAGPSPVACCDLRCVEKPELIAYNIPQEYLIDVESIEEWAIKISDWFRNFNG
jgi:hypothetical protein